MVFSSAIFLVWFLPLLLLVHNAAPGRWRNAILLAFSVLFYAYGAPRFVFLLLASTIADYYLVGWMHRSIGERKKWLLRVSLGLNLGLLAWFKYANFLVANAGAMGFDAANWTTIALPIGISFYTFQTLTYSIDVYRGVHAPLRDPLDYLLYIFSFPQMIAGPIVRFGEVAAQLTGKRPVKTAEQLLGFQRLVVGLAKKVLIANVLGEQADAIFGTPAADLDVVTAWVGAVAYAGQIYFDFSGYSDMAIGLGRLFGFRFPENFNNPYLATSITDFWRRWHITLGRFMRDYLYIPLGGNRGSTARTYVNLWTVFLLSGLWHGASWNFVIWGAYHGLFLVLDRLFLRRWLARLGRLGAVVVTCFLVIVGWVFFRLETFGAAVDYLSVMFGGSWAGVPNLPVKFWWTLGASLVISWSLLTGVGRRLEGWVYPATPGGLSRWSYLINPLVYLLVLTILSGQGFNPFIYYRF